MGSSGINASTFFFFFFFFFAVVKCASTSIDQCSVYFLLLVFAVFPAPCMGSRTRCTRPASGGRRRARALRFQSSFASTVPTVATPLVPTRPRCESQQRRALRETCVAAAGVPLCWLKCRCARLQHRRRGVVDAVVTGWAAWHIVGRRPSWSLCISHTHHAQHYPC